MTAEVETVKFLLESLTEKWTSYKNLKTGAPNEFNQLKSALAELENFLQKTDQEQRGYFTENEIRDLFYEVEDTIEFWLTKKDAKNKGWFNRMKDIFNTEMEQEIKLLREKIQPTVDRIKDQNFEIKENNYRPSTSLQVTIPMEVNMDQLSGPREQPSLKKHTVSFQDEDKIIDKLMDTKDTLDVISITGVAGIGKTTFARKIYEHEMVVAKFKFRFWIHVSENFNRMEALRYIMKEITFKDTVVNNECDLMRSVSESLKNKEFLLVVDNVWRKEDWDNIREILPTDKGTVLLTTRDTLVAGGANIYRTPHHLDGLSPGASFELLILQVFDKVGDCDKELEEVGNDIAKKCGGVPLVILVIGGILKRISAKARSVLAIKKEWLKVSTTVNEFLKNDDEKLISGALEMSYKKLGHDQRACFLYLGLFPENHEIPVSTLTQLWIAEGFIKWKEGENESLEKKAENILNVLITMNLLMVTKRNLEQVKKCWAHDMVREFCRSKAQEEKLFRVVQESIGEGPDPPFANAPEFRRLCFDSDPTKFLITCPNDPNAKHVRSLLCFYKESIKLQHVTFPAVCNYLRVLNCRSTKFSSFPEVKKLILLKHITLSIENLQVLPEDISQLVNLQTLIVDTKQRIITIKANISKMIRLRRLKTKAAIYLDDKKWKVKACYNLQTFSRLSPKSCKQVLSKRAPNLKALGVRGKLINVVDAMFLKDFNRLEKLKVINDPNDQSKPSSPLFFAELHRFFPPNLQILTLAKTDTDLKWDVHMRLLAKMKHLRILKLKDNAFTGEEWIVGVADIFPALEFFLIEKSGLVKWIADEYNFPKLMSLVIKNCEDLTEIPRSPGEYLESLEIDLVNKSIVESAKRIEEIQIKRHQNHKREIPFKLTIGPGCDLDLISETINSKDDEQ